MSGAVWMLVLEESGGKNASQTDRRNLLAERAVRRCAGMQPAARWSPPRDER